MVGTTNTKVEYNKFFINLLKKNNKINDSVKKD